MEVNTILFALIGLGLALTGRGFFVLIGAYHGINTLTNTEDSLKKSQKATQVKRDVFEGVFHLGFVAVITVAMFLFATIGDM